jgi:AcrR family transcriptional regulator
MRTTADPLREAIVDTALELGEQVGWNAVHLHEVAQALGIGLADIAQRFAHKDAIAEAWFDRADQALLAAPSSPGWEQLDPQERLHAAVFTWLDALAPHRRLSGQMLRYKLHPEHLHLQALGAVRVSRTVQTMREVAGLKAAGWRREAEEAALTAMYLSTLLSWLRDDSAGAAVSRERLRRWLARADFVARRLT